MPSTIVLHVLHTCMCMCMCMCMHVGVVCVCVCVRVHVSVYERKTERGREGERDQATAIQLAGESSTLRKDIKPGYL